jgi:hypothetical protein
MKSEIPIPKSEIAFEPGDLLLFYGRDLPSRIIEGSATHNEWGTPLDSKTTSSSPLIKKTYSEPRP